MLNMSDTFKLTNFNVKSFLYSTFVERKTSTIRQRYAYQATSLDILNVLFAYFVSIFFA